ncbi:MAG: CcmD family protein [Gemmatimonadetes bacterium]|nr:CcmD family protein [Gemmatimonadota bacterium]
MSEWSFIIAAYTVTWVVVVGYTLYIGRRWIQARRRARDLMREER